MSVPELIYCRFCAELKSTLEIMDLTTLVKIRNEVTEKLSFFSLKWLDLSSSNLPETICHTCYTSLNSAYGFFTKIKISQVILENIFTNKDHCNNSYDYSITHVKKEINVSDCEDGSIRNSEVVSEIENDGGWSLYPWFCKRCKVMFDGADELRNHSKEIHRTCNSFQCGDCEICVGDFDEFVEHVRGHRKSLRSFCPHCNMKLQDPEHLSHTSLPQCATCGAVFSNKTDLKKHLSPKKKSKIYNTFRPLPSHDPQDLVQVENTEYSSTLQTLLSYGVDAENCDEITSWCTYPWICHYCNTKVVDLQLLRSHLKEAHAKCFGVKCVDCDVGIHRFEEFVEHVRGHRFGFKYHCEYCNDRVQLNNTIVHIKQHTSDHQCSSCNETFLTNTELLKHNNMYNPPKSKKRPKRKRVDSSADLTCTICHKVAKSASNLYQHKKLHTDRSRDFFCDRCGKSFFTKGTLDNHKLIHENPEPQVCKICKKSFLTVWRLKKHVATHYDVKPFQCDECNKCFRVKNQLRNHMIIHTDIFPYNCEYCNKKFKFKNVWKNHQVIHTGVRPYFCDICNMSFTNWSNCNKHMKRRHGTTLAKSKLTPNGKIPVISKTGKLKKIRDLDKDVQEWSEQLLEPKKRTKKVTI